MAPPRKHPSGAQKRKRAKEKQEQQRKEEDSATGAGNAWMEQAAYRGTAEQWDPKAPPWQLPIYGVPPPRLVAGVDAAITALEQGTFFLPAMMWDGMLRDDRISATLNVRISGLLGAPLDLEPAGDNDPARLVKEDAERCIGKMLPNPQVAQLLRYGIGLSVGIAQKLTLQNLKSYTPTIRTWNPRFMRYDWLIRKFCLITENRGEIAIEPGDPEWVVYEPFGEHGWLHGAALRSLALPWLVRRWTRDWWARYQEVHGQPLRLGVIPADRIPRDERIFLSQLSNLAHEAVIRVPAGREGKGGFDVRLLEAQANNWEGFDKLLEHCDKSIDISLLGQSQSTEGQGGLGTQEKAGESTLLRILRGDALIGNTLREQVLFDWAQANHGDPELAPYLKWSIEPPEDLEAKSKSLWMVSQSVEKFRGVPEVMKHIDVRALLEEYHLPLVDVDDVPPDVPGTPNPHPMQAEGDPEQPPAAPPAEDDDKEGEDKDGT